MKYLGDIIEGNQTDWNVNSTVEPIINNSTVDIIRKVFLICLEYYGVENFRQMLNNISEIQTINQSFYPEMIRLINLTVKELEIEAKRLKIERVNKLKKLELLKIFTMNVY